jgi:hypothetical protein
MDSMDPSVKISDKTLKRPPKSIIKSLKLKDAVSWGPTDLLLLTPYNKRVASFMAKLRH